MQISETKKKKPGNPYPKVNQVTRRQPEGLKRLEPKRSIYVEDASAEDSRSSPAEQSRASETTNSKTLKVGEITRQEDKRPQKKHLKYVSPLTGNMLSLESKSSDYLITC